MARIRNEMVTLRVSAAQKEDWSKAAGGQYQLAKWIRGSCEFSLAMQNGWLQNLPEKPVPVVETVPAPSLREIVSVGLVRLGRALA